MVSILIVKNEKSIKNLVSERRGTFYNLKNKRKFILRLADGEIIVHTFQLKWVIFNLQIKCIIFEICKMGGRFQEKQNELINFDNRQMGSQVKICLMDKRRVNF